MLEATNLIGFGCGGSACECVPSYVTGDRQASITVTDSGSLIAGGTASNWVDGGMTANTTDSLFFNDGQTVSSSVWIKFQFAAKTKITEAKLYIDTASTYGTWKWQGSNDDSSWTDIGSSFTLGNAGGTTQTQTELAGNTEGYFYYRLIGVSGTGATPARYLKELEFQQCTC